MYPIAMDHALLELANGVGDFIAEQRRFLKRLRRSWETNGPDAKLRLNLLQRLWDTTRDWSELQTVAQITSTLTIRRLARNVGWVVRDLEQARLDLLDD